MYPDLSYIMHDIFGSEPDNVFAIFKTFGLFLALAFLGSAYVLYLEFKRKETEGLFLPRETTQTLDQSNAIKGSIINALIGFFIFFKAPFVYENFSDFKVDPASMVFSGKGSILPGLIGLVLFGAYSYYSSIKHEHFGKILKFKTYPSERIADITMVAAISGIFGARLFSIFENMDGFWQDPIGTLFSGSGLTVYGGLIVGTIVVYWYVKSIGLKPIHVMDAAAPAIIIGQLIGRMGCQFSGDGDWGIVNAADKPSWFVFPDWAWSYSYPRNVLNRGEAIPDCIGNYCNQMVPGVYPTPIYEVLAYALIFGLLWYLRKRTNIPGILFFMFLIPSGLARFFVENIRVNDRYDVLGFQWSLSQAIAVGFVLIGIAGTVYLWNKSKNRATV